MAYVAGQTVTAALLNEPFPVGIGAWTDYTPTFTQSATITKTIQTARYTKVGRTTTFQVYLTATSAGTANNSILVGLPVAASTGALLAGIIAGGAWLADASTVLQYTGAPCMAAGSVCGIFISGSTYPNLAGKTGGGFPATAIAAGDEIVISATYESAT